MAFTGQTPEALLERSDSKNPATTCKGITKLGRPCRNPLKFEDNGVLAVTSVVDDSDDEEIAAAAFFCHKHKDQAQNLVAANASASTPHRQDTHIYPLQKRNSVDTLLGRLGVLEVNENPQLGSKRRGEQKRRNGRNERKPSRRVNRPPTWDRVQGPLMEVPSDLMNQKASQDRPPRTKPSFWQSLCCGAADDDYTELVRHKKRVNQRPAADAYSQGTSRPPGQPGLITSARPNGRSPRTSSNPANTIPARRPLSEKPARPMNTSQRQQTTETANLLSHIPKHIAPQTASLLLAELAKPISSHDDEGYIYIFWLTPESAGPAPSSVASGLLAPPSRPEQARRTSDVLRQYSVRKPQRSNPDRNARRRSSTAVATAEEDTILLKIGKANNVHRRMNEWTRQCGYDLSLVRFYPYVPSTPSPSPHASPRGSPARSRRQSAQNANSPAPSAVRKVPHARRVERLIHLELAEQRVVKQCEACGKEHREWFQVRATSEGVKAVDEVVKRWVSWAERAGNSLIVSLH